RSIHRELYSRKQGVELLKSIITKNGYNWMPQIEDLPQICSSHAEIISLQKRWGRIVVKAPWSSSGRGLQILRPGEYNQTNRQVISGFLNQQGYVVAETWYNKLFDLSFQFFSTGKGNVEYRGLSSFVTDKSGRYKGSYIEEIPMEINERLKEFLAEHVSIIQKLLTHALSGSPYSTEYYGWIGVDSLLYETEKGQFMFHPCIEVNCRYTMGAIALALRNHLAEGSTGVFRIYHGKDGQFLKYCEEMKSGETVLMNKGKIVRGFLPLTPPSTHSLFGAYLNVYDH
ncbi:MAG: hypothetical protein WCL00_10915, partial [Bacteroidota bacterium]